MTCRSHRHWLDILIIFEEGYTLWNSSSRHFLHPPVSSSVFGLCFQTGKEHSETSISPRALSKHLFETRVIPRSRPTLYVMHVITKPHRKLQSAVKPVPIWQLCFYECVAWLTLRIRCSYNNTDHNVKSENIRHSHCLDMAWAWRIFVLINRWRTISAYFFWYCRE
jgi:hypothetical protein